MRHDDEVLKSLRRHTPSRNVMQYLSKPFLYLGNIDNQPEADIAYTAKNILSDPDEIEAIIPFDDFLVYIPKQTLATTFGINADGTLVEHLLGFDAVVELKYVKEENQWLILLFLREKNKACVVGTIVNIHAPDSEGRMFNVLGCNQAFYRNKKRTVGFDLKNNVNDPIVRKAYDSVTTNSLLTLSEIITSLDKARHKHLVEVRAQSIDQPKRKKGSGVLAPRPENLPHYVYLDAPHYTRETNASDEPGTGSRKRGHHRRGTWVHLRADRYKHHPKYGDRIWRRPTWVGPTTWTVDNTIYTLKDINV